MRVAGYNPDGIDVAERDATWAGREWTCRKCGTVATLEGRADIEKVIYRWMPTYVRTGTLGAVVACPNDDCAHEEELYVKADNPYYEAPEPLPVAESEDMAGREPGRPDPLIRFGRWLDRQSMGLVLVGIVVLIVALSAVSALIGGCG